MFRVVPAQSRELREPVFRMERASMAAAAADDAAIDDVVRGVLQAFEVVDLQQRARASAALTMLRKSAGTFGNAERCRLNAVIQPGSRTNPVR
jgi:hypothetical protein